MVKIRFYRELDSRWYADLPDWKGSKAELEMVSGADTMLDLLAEDKAEVTLRLYTTKVEGADELQIVDSIMESGAEYFYISTFFDPLKIWLCDVTKFVFGEFPEILYVIKENE